MCECDRDFASKLPEAAAGDDGWTGMFFTPRRLAATFLLQTAFNSDFHQLVLIKFFHNIS